MNLFHSMPPRLTPYSDRILLSNLVCLPHLKFTCFYRVDIFVVADIYLQKARKNYQDSRGSRNKLAQINSELRDVHVITIQNIEDVLQRGEALSGERYIEPNFLRPVLIDQSAAAISMCALFSLCACCLVEQTTGRRQNTRLLRSTILILMFLSYLHTQL